MTRLLLTLLSFGLYLSAAAQCQADFTYSVNNGTVTFTNTSTGGGLFNNWTFGDGNSSYQSNPTHIYTSTGTYVVCLSIFDSLSQCQDYYCDTIFVQSAGGTGCNVTSNAYANANGTIIGTASGAAGYNWSVYDNSWNYLYGTNNNNLNYNPGTSGIYNVCLFAYDSLQNLCDSTCYTVTVIDSTGGGGGTGCNVTSNAYATANGTIIATASGAAMYNWAVYDNSWNYLFDTNNSILSYTPGSNGIYNVCLTAFDSLQNFCDSSCYTVTVIDSTGGGGTGCNLTSNAYANANGTIIGTASGAAGYNWSVYDNSWNYLYGTNNSNLNYNPGTSGIYNVCLFAYDSLQNFCDSTCYTVTVIDSTGGGGGTGCNVTSNAYATANGTIIATASGAATYNWAVYDNSWNYLFDTNNSTLSYTPGSNGIYNVCLTAFDSLQNFCDSSCYTITVIDSTGGGGSGCNLSSNAYGAGSSIIGVATGASMYHWIVYDNSWNFLYDTNNSNFTYNPGFSGLFNVCITAYDSQQNVCDSTCYTLQIIDSTGGNGCLISSSASIDQNGNIVGSATGAAMFHWIVYDNSWNLLYDTNNSNVTYAPTNPGTYNVCLTAYDSLQNVCDSMCYTLTTDSLAGLTIEEEIVFNVYPNPTQGVIHLEVSNDHITEIILIDITGSVLLQQAITESTTDIDLSLYPKGMYFIHALGRKGQRLSTSKVLRQ